MYLNTKGSHSSPELATMAVEIEDVPEQQQQQEQQQAQQEVSVVERGGGRSKPPMARGAQCGGCWCRSSALNGVGLTGVALICSGVGVLLLSDFSHRATAILLIGGGVLLLLVWLRLFCVARRNLRAPHRHPNSHRRSDSTRQPPQDPPAAAPPHPVAYTGPEAPAAANGSSGDAPAPPSASTAAPSPPHPTPASVPPDEVPPDEVPPVENHEDKTETVAEKSSRPHFDLADNTS